MKKSSKRFVLIMLSFLVSLFLVNIGFAAPTVVVADAPNSQGPTGVIIMAQAIRSLSTRSGPSTGYSSLGKYNVKNQKITIISQSTDSGGVCWLQCEVHATSGGLRRVYAVDQGFNPKTFKYNDIPVEMPLFTKTVLRQDTTPRYGPGADYMIYDSEFLKLYEGTPVQIVTYENDYAQIEFKATNQENGITSYYRVWVEKSALEL